MTRELCKLPGPFVEHDAPNATPDRPYSFFGERLFRVIPFPDFIVVLIHNMIIAILNK